MARQSFVYFLSMETSDRIKIGCSISPIVRQMDLQHWSPYPLIILAQAPGDSVTEMLLHQRFAADHRRGEWFEMSTDLLQFIEIVKQDGAIPLHLLGPDLSWMDDRRKWKSRLSAVLQLLGMTEREFAAALGYHPATVRNWVECGISRKAITLVINFARDRGVELTARDLFTPRIASQDIAA